ncbi:hypothetical protein [Streptomyces sp. enrichment culture]|uniref:hypothetical protein n=1 Tax=Streptomyces sp. enrichment culture TaxID=1795815 RepID=UPI003F55B154
MGSSPSGTGGTTGPADSAPGGATGPGPVGPPGVGGSAGVTGAGGGPAGDGHSAPAGHPAAGSFPGAAGAFGPPGAAGHPGGYPGQSAGAGYFAAGGHPGMPGYPAAPPPAAPRSRRLRTAVAVGAAVAVLAGVGVGVYALTDDSGGNSATSQAPGGPGAPRGQESPRGDGGSGGSDGQSPGPRQPEPPKIRSGSVTDRVGGISLPIPEGWYGQEGQAGAQVTSEESYKCPGDTASTCTKGGAYSAPAIALGTKGDTPEEIAKADIAANAEESYGGKAYGGITSHDVLASEAVTVAGQKGYLVRWKAVTSKGADGIVESLAFPSPANAELMVVVRFGVDADQKESVLDEITRGIKVSTGRGNGQDV